MWPRANLNYTNMILSCHNVAFRGPYTYTLSQLLLFDSEPVSPSLVLSCAKLPGLLLSHFEIFCPILSAVLCVEKEGGGRKGGGLLCYCNGSPLLWVVCCATASDQSSLNKHALS